MTINPVSTGSTLYDHLKQIRQTDLQKLAGDISTRNDHMTQMMKDLESGDVDGAKQELAAVRDAQKSIKADRAQLTDLRNNVQNLRTDLAQRNQDIQDFKTAVQNHDWSGAKQAFEAVLKMRGEIRGDVRQIRGDGS
jgi:phage shock protein A